MIEPNREPTTYAGYEALVRLYMIPGLGKKRLDKRYCEKAGVPRIRVHGTRHTCASLLAALDVHPRVAMRILRHSQISVTMNVYTQVPSPETRKALDRLNSSFEDR